MILSFVKCDWSHSALSSHAPQQLCTLTLGVRKRFQKFPQMRVQQIPKQLQGKTLQKIA